MAAKVRENWPVDVASVLAPPITLIREQRSQNTQCPLLTYWQGGSFLTRYVNRLTDWLLVLPKVEAREPEFTHPLLLLDQCNVREFYYRLVIEGYFFYTICGLELLKSINSGPVEQHTANWPKRGPHVKNLLYKNITIESHHWGKIFPE